MKNKKLFIIIAIVIVAAIILPLLFALFILSIPTIFLSIYAYLQPAPPKPEIIYGEFPFELVYSIDGEIITIQDTYVCEYDGWDVHSGSLSKVRAWDGYIKSTGADELILLEDGNLKFACSLGSPEYYMSDPSKPTKEYTPHIYYIEDPNDFGGRSSGTLDIEPLLEKYKIKLISWKFSDPIENSFERKGLFSVFNKK